MAVFCTHNRMFLSSGYGGLLGGAKWLFSVLTIGCSCHLDMEGYQGGQNGCALCLQ